MKVCEEIKKPGVCCFVMLQFLILIAYIAGPTFWFRCAKRGVCTRWCKLDGTCGGRSVVWNLGSMETFTWLSLKWFQLVAVGMKKLTLFHETDLRIASDCLDFHLWWKFFRRGGASVTPPPPPSPPLPEFFLQVNSHAWKRKESQSRTELRSCLQA